MMSVNEFFCAYGDGYRLIQSSIAVPAALLVRITTSALPMYRRQMDDNQRWLIILNQQLVI